MSSLPLHVQGWNFTDASLTSVYENGYIKEAIDISAGTKWRILKSAVETLGQLHLYSGSDILDIHDEDTDNGPGSIRSFWSWRVSSVHIAMPSCLCSHPMFFAWGSACLSVYDIVFVHALT